MKDIQLKIWISIFLLVCCTYSIQAQQDYNYQFKTLSTENTKLVRGLSQNSVHAILQDYKGYLWFGTWDGLNRYDGYSFTYFYEKDGLNSSTITSLFEDLEGDIWVGTEDGINLYKRDLNKFYSFRHKDWDSTSLVADMILDIKMDLNGNIWIASNAGLSKYDKEKNEFINFLNRDYDNNWFVSNQINCLLQDGEYMWLGTEKGLVRINIFDYRIKRYYYNPPGGPEHGPQITCLYKSSGKLWVGTKNGLITFDSKSENFSTLDNCLLAYSNISALYQDSKSRLWIGTDGGGLFVYDLENEWVQEYYNETGVQHSLSNDRVQSILEDKVGNIWIGTFNGVNQAGDFTSPFKGIIHSDEDENSISNDYVINVLRDDEGYLWVATDFGLNRIDEKKNEVVRYVSNPIDSNSISDNDLKDLLIDSKGQLWITTEQGGINVMDRKSQTFKSYTNDIRDKESISSNKTYIAVEDTNGYIWIASDHGLNRFNPITEKFKRYYHDKDDQSSLPHNHIWNLLVDSKGVLYVSTRNGLCTYNFEKDAFDHVQLGEVNTPCASDKDIFVVFEDSYGYYWVGTRGAGLKMFIPGQGLKRCYTKDDGLSNNLIYAILEDDEANLWISTNEGLSKFNRTQGNFMNYSAKDGLLSNEFNLWSAWKDDDGKMYFGSMNGLNYFYPENVKSPYRNPPVVITSVSIYNDVLSREIDDGDTLYLEHTENFFTIEFASLDYSPAKKNKYKYKLSSVDKDFIVTESDNRRADYRDLSPGKYVFELIGTNQDGFWNSDVVYLHIIISPPWYATPLFRYSVIGALLIIIYLLITFRIRNIRARHDVEKRMLTYEMSITEARQQALRLQMNPHFIFNSLNSIQSFILNNNIDVAISYLGKFSQLMRSNLSNSREAYITVEDEIRSLRYYLEIEKLRFEDKFDYEIKLDPQIDEEFIGIPPMLIQPFVENAILHGLVNKKEGGRITIDIRQEGETLQWNIEDNGLGRELARQRVQNAGLRKKSRGLAITRERLELLNKQEDGQYSLNVIDLLDDDNKPCGTRVELRIALKEI